MFNHPHPSATSSPRLELTTQAVPSMLQSRPVASSFEPNETTAMDHHQPTPYAGMGIWARRAVQQVGLDDWLEYEDAFNHTSLTFASHGFIKLIRSLIPIL